MCHKTAEYFFEKFDVLNDHDGIYKFFNKCEAFYQTLFIFKFNYTILNNSPHFV